MSLIKRIRLYFLTGILAVFPLLIILLVMNLIVKLLNQFSVPLFSHIFSFSGFWAEFLDFFTGLLLTILVIICVGAYTARAGKRGIGEWIRGLLRRLPLISSLYEGIRKLLEILFIEKPQDRFRQVVLVEYPRQGVWSVGFVTSFDNPDAKKATNKEVLNVYLPTSLNLASGFLILIPKEDVIFLDMKVEDAFRMVVSGGVLLPKQRP